MTEEGPGKWENEFRGSNILVSSFGPVNIDEDRFGKA